MFHFEENSVKCGVQYEQFILEELQYVMDADGLASSHPVYIPVNHPDEISQIFDIISYSKVRPLPLCLVD